METEYFKEEERKKKATETNAKDNSEKHRVEH